MIAIIIVAVNNSPAHTLFQQLPVVGQLTSETPTGSEIVFEAVIATMVIIVALVPLYNPRPRRILDAILDRAEAHYHYTIYARVNRVSRLHVPATASNAHRDYPSIAHALQMDPMTPQRYRRASYHRQRRRPLQTKTNQRCRCSGARVSCFDTFDGLSHW